MKNAIHLCQCLHQPWVTLNSVSVCVCVCVGGGGGGTCMRAHMHVCVFVYACLCVHSDMAVAVTHSQGSSDCWEQDYNIIVKLLF